MNLPLWEETILRWTKCSDLESRKNKIKDAVSCANLDGLNRFQIDPIKFRIISGESSRCEMTFPMMFQEANSDILSVIDSGEEFISVLILYKDRDWSNAFFHQFNIKNIIEEEICGELGACPEIVYHFEISDLESISI